MTITISGTGISRGIAIGRAQRLDDGELEIYEAAIPKELIEDEVARFRRAVHTARQQLKAIRNSIPEATSADITDFIDTHLLMMEDSMLTAAPIERIRHEHCCAEWALKSQRDELAQVFDEMDDPYLRTRKDDIDHVVTRIQRILIGEKAAGAADEKHTLEGTIVLAHDLNPAEAALLQHQGIAGFVTESGGPLSHTAILARSLGMPAIVGTHITPQHIRDGDTVILDGSRGLLLADIDEDTLKDYHRQQRQQKKHQVELKRLKNEPAVTADNIPVNLFANVELLEDIRAARQSGADGIGLFRTEFLFMNRNDIPDEEEQLKHYLALIRSMRGLPVIIRTLDLGADKECGASEKRNCPNPALGLRAIRLCLNNIELFRPQLRAILRASAKGPVQMMIPMLSSSSELDRVIELIEEVKQQLQDDGLAFDRNLPVGGMIEVPAAALSASLFARKLDFLSIGTNDLIQYALAIDRTDDSVTYLYDPLHPGVLKLVRMVIDACQQHLTPVAMCGEMAGDPRYTRLLLGMGLRQFSVPPTSLFEVKDAIRRCDTRLLSVHIDKILASDDPQQIHAAVDDLNTLH
ncbi:phosphoenolpyruvate--protein phosphotransferase [Thiogranum longum]|uniref:Phosphoenolpyruvate-protein phosphotransferase n=1 Tax=Thiogranum longum TaxID=1537524 RepID=A0A4R1HBJ8_9GAMM|nr:phosphoenolpyruvate--protein phosphotransferase [Thiogranum longum]TCK17550.1 phosphoenolpyruvate--protein phosphotransferase [Thiogranum longum]